MRLSVNGRIDSFGAVAVLMILLVEGFVTISVQMLTIRQLIPVIGNTVVVTSLIIGIFLLFLALGYYRGGYYKGNFKAVLVRNFITAGVFLGLGLSYQCIQAFFFIGHAVVSKNPLIILTAYLLCVIAPTVYWLGQTVPITTNLFKTLPNAARISGKALSISTLGSFLGAILTSLWLMNWLGVAATVVFNYALLSFLVILVIPKEKNWIMVVSVMLITLAVPIYHANVVYENHRFVATDVYANYRVTKTRAKAGEKAFKIFQVNDSYSSLIAKDLTAAPYIQRMRRILFDDLKLKHQRILVLGAGGFTLSARSAHDNQIIYNDIDPNIKSIVKKHFLKKINGQFIVGDARAIVHDNKKPFNVIISDSYSSAYSIPFHLLTQDHMDNIKRALTPDGIAIFNIIAKPSLSSRYATRINATILSVFHHCMIIPKNYKPVLQNILYVCRRSPQHNQPIVYTDDKNPASLDYYQTGMLGFAD
jgi:spermidine synthase